MLKNIGEKYDECYISPKTFSELIDIWLKKEIEFKKSKKKTWKDKIFSKFRSV
jgi:hypothetical protein